MYQVYTCTEVSLKALRGKHEDEQKDEYCIGRSLVEGWRIWRPKYNARIRSDSCAFTFSFPRRICNSRPTESLLFSSLGTQIRGHIAGHDPNLIYIYIYIYPWFTVVAPSRQRVIAVGSVYLYRAWPLRTCWPGEDLYDTYASCTTVSWRQAHDLDYLYVICPTCDLCCSSQAPNT